MSSVRGITLSCLFVFAACAPPAPSERVELSPGELSLQFGEAQTVTARVLQGTKLTSLDGLSWTSSDPSLVEVTAGDDGTARVQGLNAGTATVTAAVRNATASITVRVAARIIKLESIELTPENPMVAKGLRLQLHATGHYNDGTTRDLTTTAAWASGDGSRAIVSSAGLVTATGLGTVEVRALKDGFVGRVMLTVTAASIVGVDLRPTQVSLARGTSQQFSATARLSDATTQDVSSQVVWASGDSAIATTDANGRVTAANVGATTLTATLGELSGTAQVTVTSALLRTLEVVPGSTALPLGSTQQLRLNGHYSDGTDQDVTSRATWRSGTAAVATVSTGGLVTSVGLGLSVITGTVDGISAASSVTCIAAQLQAIQVAPQGLSLARGLVRDFTATAIFTDATTRDISTTVIWNSSDAGVASVTAAGQVTAIAEGNTSISATNGTLTGSSTLTVTPAQLLSVQLTPLTAMVPNGLTQQVTARGTYSDGSQRDVTAQLTWVSTAATVASVSNSLGTEGLVRGASIGTTTITASLGLVSASMSIEVIAPRLDRIDVTAPALSLAKGRSQQLTATGVYSDGTTGNLTSTATWAPATGTVLRVSSSGSMTALLVGTGAATASVGTVIGSLDLTVTAAELEGVTLTPSTTTLALGLTTTLVARTTWSDGTTLVPTSGVTWLSSDDTIATVVGGLVTSLTEGQVTITASTGGFSGTATVNVGPPAVTTLTVTPANPALDKAQVQQLAVDALYTNGTTGSVTGQVTWLSSVPAVATVSSTGEVLAVTPGTTTITASLGAIDGTTVITVNRPALQSLTVTPASSSILVGASSQFAALATYVDSSTEIVTSLVTWSTSDGAVASISAAGLALGLTQGTVTISATWNTITGTTDLTVTPPVLQSIVVTGRTKLAAGTGAQLTATATYSDNSTADVTALATWASSTAYATFTNLAGVRGVMSGIFAGTTSVTATIGAIVSPGFSVQVLDANAPYAGRCGPGLVISQIYGGGGNSGAPWTTDFIELHNPTTTGIPLGGLSLQYASATGSSWGSNMTSLPSVTVPAGAYYLVQLGNGGGTIAGTPLSNPDHTASSINMSGTAGKVALVAGTTGLSGNCPTASVLDFVGYGTTADCFEGARAPVPSATASIIRGSSGCRDANQNSTDFTTSNPIVPRSLASTQILCSCFVNETDVAAEVSACQLQAIANFQADAGTVSTELSALVTQPGYTDSAGFDSRIQVQVGFGPPAANPINTAGWKWWPAPGSTAGTTSDAYAGNFVVPGPGSYAATARVTKDGVNWTACDLNGAGSGTGLAFETTQLSLFTVP